MIAAVQGGAAAGPPEALGRARAGLLGLFDVESLAAIALPQMLAEGLRRWRPDLDVVTVAPLGAARPLGIDGGTSALPLAEAGVALEDAACVVLAGPLAATDEALAALYGAAAPGAAPAAALLAAAERAAARGAALAWHGADLLGDGTAAELARLRQTGMRISAASVAARRRLGAAGLDAAAVDVVPPALLHLDRLVDRDVRFRRRDLLRLLGWLPGEDGYTVLEVGAGESVEEAEQVAASLAPTGAVVLAALDRSGLAEDHVGAIAARLGDRCHFLDGSCGLEDLAAAVEGASRVLARTADGAAAAISLGVAVLPVGSAAEPAELTAVPAEELRRRLDAELEALASLCRGSGLAMTTPSASVSPPAASPDIDSAAATALAVLRRRLVEERTVLAAAVASAEARTRAAEEELERVRHSRGYRYLAPARAAYGRLRSLLDR